MKYEVTEWWLQEGERLTRRELHDLYGGNRQRGIAPSRKSPNIFLFSDPAAAGLHGYEDDLQGAPIEYYGEGQSGDMEMSHGNLAVLRHQEDGRSLRLFRVHEREVEYLGEYVLDQGEPYVLREAAQTSVRSTRKAIVFRLCRSQ